MRFYLAGLLLLVAVSVAQAQEYPPLDTSEIIRTLNSSPFATPG